MSNPIRKQHYQNFSGYDQANTVRFQNHSYKTVPVKKISKTKVKKHKKSFIATVFALFLLGIYGYYVCPYNFDNYFRPLYLNRVLNKNFKVDATQYVSPTLNYLYNSTFLDSHILSARAQKSKEMSDIKIISELTDTKNKLLDLFKKYPKLQPAVFVWEYSTGYGLEINSDEVYPAASLIKIPMAFELMRKIEASQKTQSPLALTDRRQFDEFFRTAGSGNLQKSRGGVMYSLDYLANIMISESDNSASNMILQEIGGKDAFNRQMRNMGLKVTQMEDWLPDIEGYNKTTAREISKILYNLDNPSYINTKYKNVLKEYLGNTRNIHLLKEKLPPDVMILHKTGNIGSMIGDSGVIYTDNGKKYIVTIMVKRPTNDYAGKLLIQEASAIIYEDIKSLQ